MGRVLRYAIREQLRNTIQSVTTCISCKIAGVVLQSCQMSVVSGARGACGVPVVRAVARAGGAGRGNACQESVQETIIRRSHVSYSSAQVSITMNLLRERNSHSRQLLSD